MSSTSRQAVDPDQDVTVSRELLAQMDDAATSREHWKILITSGMGFFTDAYDLFIIGVVAVMIKTERRASAIQGHQPGGLHRAAHRQQRGRPRRGGEPRRPAAQCLIIQCLTNQCLTSQCLTSQCLTGRAPAQNSRSAPSSVPRMAA
jgi:hypothetical protein